MVCVQALKINGLDEVSYRGYSQFYKNQDFVIPRQTPAQISQSRTTTASKGGSEGPKGPRKEGGTREMESTSQAGIKEIH